MNPQTVGNDSEYERELDAFIRQVFEQNYEALRLDSGHAITPDVKETALNQVLFYWQKLREIAENVTDTEVRLSLPNQETPRGLDYTIEGVVDIVRDSDRTVMYDIKTHNAEYVRANCRIYEEQLNIYAYIWKNLRRQALDEMAVIATDYPDAVREAIANGNPRQIAYELERWEPVVPISFDEESVASTIRAFGEVVDQIEEGRFAPPSLAALNTILAGTQNIRFATNVCRNCDARFSCSSYRQYAVQGRGGIAEQRIRQYFLENPTDLETETWRTAGLEGSTDAGSLRADYSNR